MRPPRRVVARTNRLTVFRVLFICCTLPLVSWLILQTTRLSTKVFESSTPPPVQATNKVDAEKTTSDYDRDTRDSDNVPRAEIQSNTVESAVKSTLIKVKVDTVKNDKFPPAPPIPSGVEPVLLALDAPSGRFCNQILSLSTAMERVKRRPDAKLAIWGPWLPLVYMLDQKLLEEWLGGSHKVEYSESAPRKKKDTSAWWDRACTERVSRDSIRRGIRPKKEYMDEAQKRIDSFKSKGVKQIIAVHLRHMEGTCYERTNEPDKFGAHCHVTSKKYQGALDQCRYMPDELFFKELQNEYPDLHKNKKELGVFLSSDGANSEWRGDSLRVLGHYHESADIHSPSGMVEDMWTSTLSDFYVANTMSSCEGIIAQWRDEILGPKSATVYPKTCFEGYRSFNVETEPLCGPGARWELHLNT